MQTVRHAIAVLVPCLLSVGCGTDYEEEWDDALAQTSASLDAALTPPSRSADAGVKSDAGDSGASKPASGASGAIEFTGTWFTKVITKATITAPLVGASPSDIEMALKLMVTNKDGKLSADVSLCNLDTKSPSLALNLDKVEKFIKVSASIPDFAATVGGKVPLPEIAFRIGQDASGSSVDLDGDGSPGGTVGVVALGAVPFDAYIGLALNIKMDAKLSDASTVVGTATFAGDGKVFGSTIPLLSSGAIKIEQSQTPTSFSAAHTTGDVPCDKLLAGKK